MPFCPVPEVPIMLRRRFVLQSETRSCIGVETTSERVSVNALVVPRDCHWARRPGKRVDQSSQCRCQGSWKPRSTRRSEEQLPWQYFDLSPPGVSHDPQYGGPSTSNDVPMTPVPVPDASMPDVIADEPDTSKIPVLPNSVFAPVRNPRVRWRSDALEHPTPQLILPPVVSSQNVPSATPSWSPPLPVTRETPSTQQLVTPHVDSQSEFPLPAPTADDEPMPLPHVDDTP